MNKTGQEESKTDKMKKSHMEVYTIVRNNDGKGGFFVRCGAGFRNEKDGSLTILLNHLPVNGELHVRSPKDKSPGWKAIPLCSYRVFELPQKETENPKWREVGVAHGNKDESLNIRLNLYPNGRRLNVRLPKEAE